LKNYYAILEVPVGCSLEEIRQSYRRLAQDNLDNAEIFAQLKEAHEVLTSPERREGYDRENWGEHLAASSTGSTPSAAAPEAENVSRCPMGAEELCPLLQGHVAPEDRFCPECGVLRQMPGNGREAEAEEGAAAPLSPRLEEAGGQIHLLQIGNNLVGREVAEVLLNDKTISRQHARLEVTESGQVLLEDLSSTNGTQINDRPLSPHLPRAVTNGDTLRFGSVLTTLVIPTAEEALPVQRVPAELGALLAEKVTPSDSGGQPRLIEIKAGVPRDAAPREFLLAPGITSFGRRPESTVVLQGDPYVSGSHAQIIAESGIVRIVDVGSTNGTLLNGQRLTIDEPVTLTSGDLIVIGGSTLRFESVSAEESTKEYFEESHKETASEVPTEG